MGFTEFNKSIRKHNKPMVNIDKYHFNFSVYFSQVAGLDRFERVTYELDKDDRVIKFRFHNNINDDKSFIVGNLRGKRSYRSGINELINKFSWIRSVAMQRDSKDRNFEAKQDGNKPEWTIQLMPAFEQSFKIADQNKIPSDLKGIYRYRDHNQNVIYIGKGNIKKRLHEKGRVPDWGIDLIEASDIKDEDMQFKWENYWIGRYAEVNNGNLPILNMVKGRDK